MHRTPARTGSAELTHGRAPEPGERLGAGLAASLVAVTGFSWGFILVKLIDLPAPVLALLRLFIGALVYTAAALILRLPWPARRILIIGPGVAFGAHQLLFIAATRLTSVAIVTLIASLQPLIVALLSHRTVGERVAPGAIGCALLAVGGVAMVLHANLGAASHSWEGDLLAVANLASFVVYFLLAKRSRTQGAPTVTMTAGLLWVALVVVLPGVAVSGPVLPRSVDWLLLVVLALGPGSGHLLVNWAHSHVSAALTSLVLALTPLLASIWAHLVLGEPYGWQHLAGIGLAVLAVEGGRRAELRASRGRARPRELPPNDDRMSR